MNLNCFVISKLLHYKYGLLNDIMYIIFEYLETVDGLFMLPTYIENYAKIRFDVLNAIHSSMQPCNNQLSIFIGQYRLTYIRIRNGLIYDYFRYYTRHPENAIMNTLHFIEKHKRILSTSEAINHKSYWPTYNETKIMSLVDYNSIQAYFDALYPNNPTRAISERNIYMTEFLVKAFK